MYRSTTCINFLNGFWRRWNSFLPHWFEPPAIFSNNEVANHHSSDIFKKMNFFKIWYLRTILIYECESVPIMNYSIFLLWMFDDSISDFYGLRWNSFIRYLCIRYLCMCTKKIKQSTIFKEFLFWNFLTMIFLIFMD